MKHHDLDRILSEEEILPSSGFTASVMDAVRREAAAPPPIPFPWKRALPGLVAGGLTLALILGVILFQPARLTGLPSPAPEWVAARGNDMAVLVSKPEWRSVGLALLVTLFSLAVPLRLILRRG
jgi:hypothetical protein